MTEAVAEARANFGADIKTALAEFLNEKINSFISFGEVNFDENQIELTVDEGSTLDLFTLLPFSSSIPLPQISLDRVVYTFDTTELEVATRSYGSQTIIPDVLDLENIALSIVVELQDINTLVVNFEGDFVIGGTSVTVTATYTHSSRDIELTADVPSITINFQSVATQLVGLDLPSALHGSITIPSFVVEGTVTLSGESELVVSATGGDIHVYIIYQKTDTSRKAIAVELSNVGLASVLDDVVGLDISDIPYFGTAVLPTIALTYATDSIDGLPEDTFSDSPLLSSLGSSIKEDLTALIMFEFSDDPIKLHYSGGIPTFQPATPGSLDVNSLISAIPNFDLSSIPLPPGVDGLSIESFAFDLDTRSFQIAVGYPGTLAFFDGLLTINDPMVVIVKSPQGIAIDVDGDLSISGSGFDVSLYRDEESGHYILEASADELPISDLISQFQSEVLPSELNSLFDSLPFFSFSIDEPSISFTLSSSPLQIQLAGTPVISGYSTVGFASVIIRQGGKTLLVQGFELGSTNLASFLRGLTGFNFNSIPILNQELEAAILISPVTLPNVQLAGDKLSGFSITKGLSVKATMQFPPDCSSDAFCAVAQSLLGEDASLNVKGTISSLSSFSLKAEVANINLGDGIVLSGAGFEIEGGEENSIGIFGSVDLSNPDITLTGRIFLSQSGVVLEMKMTGCWENAFGASFLDICSLEASVSMIPGVTLTGFSLGGEVHVGDDSCGTPLVAIGFVGIDLITPKRNYYYVNLEGSTTVGTILEAFCIDFSVPAPLAESGFPHGFLSSFSLTGVELPHVPLSIPPGFKFNGTLNILGLEASADINIGLPDGLYFGVSLPPINIAGGILEMYASSTDRSRGPFLTADIDILPPSVDIQAKGYLRVLGISLETSLTITNTQFIFEIEGKFLNLFEASLRIAAAYGDITRASFEVEGSFTNNLYSTLERQIENVLDAAAEDATRAFDAVQRELDDARDTLDSASRALDAARDDVDKAQKAFDDAVDEVEGLRRDVDSICSTRSCGSGKVFKDMFWWQQKYNQFESIVLFIPLQSVSAVLMVSHAVVQHGEYVYAHTPIGIAAALEYLIQFVKQRTWPVLHSRNPSN